MRCIACMLGGWLSAGALLLAMPLQAAPVVASDYRSEALGDGYRGEALASPGDIIWGLDFLSANQLIFTQRSGRVGVLDLHAKQVNWVAGVPKVFAQGQGGLLDVAMGLNGEWLYFTYAKPLANNLATTALARAKLINGSLQNWQDLLVTNATGSGGRHFGSRIAFDHSGHVYFSVGDRGERERAQNLHDHAGSIIRLRLNGAVPADNPFVGRANARPEIWTYGHRNPQGLVFDAANKRLWSIEHGPRGGDEINLIKRGHNYGWPTLSYGREYLLPIAVGEGTERDDMASATKVYVPSIAPSSLLLYGGSAFPAWQGQLFAGALKLRHLNRVAINRAGEAVAEVRMLEAQQNRIRALAESPNGWIYFSTDSGEISRLIPNPSPSEQSAH